MTAKKTISDQIAETLINDIINLELKPGEKLSETQLAQKLGISRAPVHDALAQLERQGLVKVVPKSGTFVSEISIKKVQDICDVRLQLECYAAEVAAHRISDEQIRALQIQFDKLMEMDPESEEKSKFVSEVDIMLHGMIFEICGNTIIPDIIDSYRPEIQRIRKANIAWANRKESTQLEMRKIFEALKHRDIYAARLAMQEHILNIKAAVGTLPIAGGKTVGE